MNCYYFLAHKSVRTYVKHNRLTGQTKRGHADRHTKTTDIPCATCGRKRTSCLCKRCSVCQKRRHLLRGMYHCPLCWRPVCSHCCPSTRMTDFLRGTCESVCIDCAMPTAIQHVMKIGTTFGVSNVSYRAALPNTSRPRPRPRQTRLAGSTGVHEAAPRLDSHASPLPTRPMPTVEPKGVPSSSEEEDGGDGSSEEEELHSRHETGMTFRWGLYMLTFAMDASRRCVNPKCDTPFSSDFNCPACFMPTVPVAPHLSRSLCTGQEKSLSRIQCTGLQYAEDATRRLREVQLRDCTVDDEDRVFTACANITPTRLQCTCASARPHAVALANGSAVAFSGHAGVCGPTERVSHTQIAPNRSRDGSEYDSHTDDRATRRDKTIPGTDDPSSFGRTDRTNAGPADATSSAHDPSAYIGDVVPVRVMRKALLASVAAGLVEHSRRTPHTTAAMSDEPYAKLLRVAVTSHAFTILEGPEKKCFVALHAMSAEEPMHDDDTEVYRKLIAWGRGGAEMASREVWSKKKPRESETVAMEEAVLAAACLPALTTPRTMARLTGVPPHPDDSGNSCASARHDGNSDDAVSRDGDGRDQVDRRGSSHRATRRGRRATSKSTDRRSCPDVHKEPRDEILLGGDLLLAEGGEEEEATAGAEYGMGHIVRDAAEAQQRGLTRCVGDFAMPAHVVHAVESSPALVSLARAVVTMMRWGREVVLCGHGMGGAFAVALAARLLIVHTALGANRLVCVTFGAPVVTSPGLGELLRGNNLAGHFHHFVYGSDVIPRLWGIDRYLGSGDVPEALRLVRPRRARRGVILANMWLWFALCRNLTVRAARSSVFSVPRDGRWLTMLASELRARIGRNVSYGMKAMAGRQHTSDSEARRGVAAAGMPAPMMGCSFSSCPAPSGVGGHCASGKSTTRGSASISRNDTRESSSPPRRTLAPRSGRNDHHGTSNSSSGSRSDTSDTASSTLIGASSAKSSLDGSEGHVLLWEVTRYAEFVSGDMFARGRQPCDASSPASSATTDKLAKAIVAADASLRAYMHHASQRCPFGAVSRGRNSQGTDYVDGGNSDRAGARETSHDNADVAPVGYFHFLGQENGRCPYLCLADSRQVTDLLLSRRHCQRILLSDHEMSSYRRGLTYFLHSYVAAEHTWQLPETV